MKQQLAKEFSRRLAKTLTAKQLATVVERNDDGETCHSHDFCDANVVMERAWRKVVGREMDLQDGGDCALWGDAWMLAKKNKFWTQ